MRLSRCYPISPVIWSASLQYSSNVANAGGDDNDDVGVSSRFRRLSCNCSGSRPTCLCFHRAGGSTRLRTACLEEHSWSALAWVNWGLLRLHFQSQMPCCHAVRQMHRSKAFFKFVSASLRYRLGKGLTIWPRYLFK